MVAFGPRVGVNGIWSGAQTTPMRFDARLPSDDLTQGLLDRRDLLARTIEADVIPRLVRARRQAARAAVSDGATGMPTAANVMELANIAMTRDVVPAAAFVESVRLRGSSLETIFLELLAPAARHLGELWEQDLAHFAEVTLGLTRLHQVLLELGPAFRAEVVASGRDLRALLVPVPGEQHTFGLSMVAEFFRRAGWSVLGETAVTRRELVASVRGAWFAVVGLSLASEVRLEELAASIRAVRQASRNPAIAVLVGGPIFNAHPELVSHVGADATAADGREAVIRARGLLPAALSKD